MDSLFNYWTPTGSRLQEGKTKGSQRIKFTLRFRTVLDFFLYDGKPEPVAKKAPPKRVEVPANYKDKLPFAFRKGDRVAFWVMDWRTGCSMMDGWKPFSKVN